jgi:Arylsulfatase A and related enzymes
LNILLVTLDTTRADRIGAYGWAKAKTPVIDTLAAGGVRFANAYCPAPLTLPSHASILTGTYPLYHKVRNNGSYYLGPEAVTLAERLKEKGYRTSAVVASFNVDSRFGLDQGFDFYDDQFSDDEMLKTFRSERRADEVADAFLSWFAGHAQEKFFAWVHFYDPHMPHDVPSPYKEEFAGGSLRRRNRLHGSSLRPDHRPVEGDEGPGQNPDRHRRRPRRSPGGQRRAGSRHLHL